MIGVGPRVVTLRFTDHEGRWGAEVEVRDGAVAIEVRSASANPRFSSKKVINRSEISAAKLDVVFATLTRLVAELRAAVDLLPPSPDLVSAVAAAVGNELAMTRDR